MGVLMREAAREKALAGAPRGKRGSRAASVPLPQAQAMLASALRYMQLREASSDQVWAAGRRALRSNLPLARKVSMESL